MYIGENKGKIILSFILSVFNFVCLFSIPYLICVAFGNGEAEYIELLTLMAFLYLAVAFMPDARRCRRFRRWILSVLQQILQQCVSPDGYMAVPHVLSGAVCRQRLGGDR